MTLTGSSLDDISGGSKFFVALFFLTLWLLGIDSAFSMLDACKTGIMDTETGQRLFRSKEICCSAVTVLAFLVSLLFCLDTGLYWLDIVDYFVNNWGMLFIGFTETMALSWVFMRSQRVAMVGQKACDIWD